MPSKVTLHVFSIFEDLLGEGVRARIHSRKKCWT